MPTTEPLGLIVDWGGVLTTPVDASFAVFTREEGIEPLEFKAAMRRLHDEQDSPLHRVEVGAIPRAEFERSVAGMLRTADGGPVHPEGLVSRMFAHALPNSAVRDLVTAARGRGWRTAVLSNSWGNPYDEEDLAGLVDAVLLSERLGVRKPEPAAYLAAADALGVEPSRCVFVDDLRRNTTAASALGMSAFQYRPGTEQMLEDLLRRQEQQ